MGKAKRKVKVKAGANKGWAIGFVFLLGAIIVTGLGVVEGAQSMRSLYSNLGATQRQQDRLLEENSRLRLERSSISSLQAIETIAVDDLDMQFPDDIEQVLQ